MVAYSGGVDSALVMFIAHQELGNRALACIGVSPSYPDRELSAAVELLKQIGAVYRLVETSELSNADYAANPANRCFFCKSELYEQLRKLADTEGWKTILDGSHMDDIGDHIGGMTAARQHGVRSPLLEAGLTKAEVRQLARDLGLSVWDKPAMACLSSRVPQGTAITPELLKRTEAAEDVLVELGFRQFRVRHHGDLARIEVPTEDLPRMLQHREQVIRGVRAAGYRHVTLDLAGFRSESSPQAALRKNRSSLTVLATMVRVMGMILASFVAVQGAQTPATRPQSPTLIDLNGVQHQPLMVRGLASVLIFIRTDCPVSNAYAPQINRLIASYGSKAIEFYVVYPMRDLTEKEARAHVKSFGYDCPAMIDRKHELVDAVGASVTPEATVIGPDGKLIYRGRIDDWFVAVGRQRYQATTHELRDALDAIVAGKPPKIARTDAVGCAISKE